jgi:hypothetical protein
MQLKGLPKGLRYAIAEFTSESKTMFLNFWHDKEDVHASHGQNMYIAAQKALAKQNSQDISHDLPSLDTVPDFEKHKLKIKEQVKARVLEAKRILSGVPATADEGSQASVAAVSGSRLEAAAGVGSSVSASGYLELKRDSLMTCEFHRLSSARTSEKDDFVMRVRPSL